MKILKILKNGREITVTNIYIEDVYSRIMIEPSSLEMCKEILASFSYPSCLWGEMRSAIIRRDSEEIMKEKLPQHFVSLWLNSTPINDENFDGSELIVSFFTNLKGHESFSELINDGLDDFENVYEEYAINFEF